jgi:hypothetical protein
MTNPRLAFYSPTAAKQLGTSFYRTPDGGEVEVTGVESSLEDSGTYMWPDKVPVVVTSYLMKGRLPDDDLDWFNGRIIRL